MVRLAFNVKANICLLTLQDLTYIRRNDGNGNKDRLMNGLHGYVKSIPFRLRWIFISPKDRYAHLWANTKKLDYLCYTVSNTAVRPDK